MSRLALRIDVDFPVGLRRGVPWLLDRLGERGMRATFFVVAGRNSGRRALLRSIDPDYLDRLRRLGPLSVARRLGASILRNEPFLESAEARAVLKRCLAEGHEIAAHGHDHAWWADEVWRAAPARLAEEIDRACNALERATGASRVSFGAPSWRTTDDVMRHLERRGVPYLSECWGVEPFRTLDGAGAPIRVPHLPITAPSLEALALDGHRDPPGAVLAALEAEADSQRLAVLCAHDYFEGLLRRDLFVALLDRLAARGLPTEPLEAAASSVAPRLDVLPACRVVRAPVSGFHGYVSWQGPPVRETSGRSGTALAAHGGDRDRDQV